MAGEIAGNAWSEVGNTAIDTQQTVLEQRADGTWRLDGTKYYTTGSIFAEWADVFVRRVRPGEEDDFAIAIVDTREDGVTVSDDWDGFGQRGTGSGTTTFEGVEVQDEHVLVFTERFPFQTALYQLNLLATLVGIGRAALARVGEIAAAEAATLRVAEAVQEAASAPRPRRGPRRWTGTGATPARSPRTPRGSSSPGWSAVISSTARRRRTRGRSAGPRPARDPGGRVRGNACHPIARIDRLNRALALHAEPKSINLMNIPMKELSR